MAVGDIELGTRGPGLGRLALPVTPSASQPPDRLAAFPLTGSSTFTSPLVAPAHAARRGITRIR
jgi:hypothetical protein